MCVENSQQLAVMNGLKTHNIGMHVHGLVDSVLKGSEATILNMIPNRDYN